jgi:hypothetical protein
MYDVFMQISLLTMSQESGRLFRRSSVTQQYTEDMGWLAHVASMLGRVATDAYVANVVQFVRAVQAGSPLRSFVLMVLHMRVRRFRVRGLMRDLPGMVLEDPGLPRWFWPLMEQSFALYCVVRQRASPRSVQPLMHTSSALHIPRSLQRRLTRRGVHSGTVYSRVVVHRMANDVLQRRWAAIAGSQLVLWFDNFVRPRSPHNPARQGRVHLNATAMAVMHVGADLDQYPGLPPLMQLVDRRQRAVDDVLAFQSVFERVWGAVLDMDLSVRDFRVPLDVMRGRVRRVRWLPLALSGTTVQQNPNLIDLLEFVKDARLQSGKMVPLLVDLDLWYRLVKMVYGRNMVSWNMRQTLRATPLLYGVWHPYKYVLTLVYREFHSFFIYLKEGTVADTFQTGSQIDVRAVELFIGALLTVTRAERQLLQAAVRRAGEAVQVAATHVADLERRVEASRSVLRRVEREYRQLMEDRRRGRRGQPYRLPQGGRSEDARLQDLESRLEGAWENLQLVKDEKNRLLAFYFLVAHYAPACLALGTMVRDCTWSCRTVGSGHRAKDVLMASLLLTMHLCEQGRTNQYVRTLCVALATWRTWNDHCPATCYSEERCEAMLSRLGSRCHQYSLHVTPSDVEDLFLAFVGPPRRGTVVLRSHQPTPDLVRDVHHRLRLLLDGGVSAIRYVPWRSTRILVVEPEWPRDGFFPRSLFDRYANDQLVELFQYELSVLVRSPMMIPRSLLDKLEGKVRRCTEEQRRQRQVAIDDLLAQNRIRRRVRQHQHL